MRILLLLCASLFALSGARAFPSLSGPTGLVALPDARLASGWDLAADVMDNTEERGVYFRAVRGFRQGELGAVAILDDADQCGVHGKWRITDARHYTAAAGGLVLQGDLVDVDLLYLAATTCPTTNIAGTLGVTWTRISTAFGAADAVRPYAGLEVRLTRQLRGVAEYQAKSDGLGEPKPITSLMLVRPYGRTVQTRVGVTNAAAWLGGAHHHLFAGVSASF